MAHRPIKRKRGRPPNPDGPLPLWRGRAPRALHLELNRAARHLHVTPSAALRLAVVRFVSDVQRGTISRTEVAK
jgi:hypothetical protein